MREPPPCRTATRRRNEGGLTNNSRIITKEETSETDKEAEKVGSEGPELRSVQLAHGAGVGTMYHANAEQVEQSRDVQKSPRLQERNSRASRPRGKA